MPLTVNGATETVVADRGKQMIFDVMEVETGKYVFSIDLGLQNLVTAIDPKTGAEDDQHEPAARRRPNQDDVPARERRPRLDAELVRRRRTKILYLPLVDACMDLVPVAPGERGSLSTGVRWTVRPRPGSDGNYGRLQAINVETRKTVWIERQRAPFTTGTAGDGWRPGVCRRTRPDVSGLRRGHRRGAVEDALERCAEFRADQLCRERPRIRRDCRWTGRVSIDQLRRARAGDQEPAGPRRRDLGVRGAVQRGDTCIALAAEPSRRRWPLREIPASALPSARVRRAVSAGSPVQPPYVITSSIENFLAVRRQRGTVSTANRYLDLGVQSRIGLHLNFERAVFSRRSFLRAFCDSDRGECHSE